MSPQSPASLPMVQRILPFALSFAANAFVKMTMRYTDMHFTLIGLVIEVIATIAIVAFLVQLLKCYVTDFVVSNLNFVLWLTVPIYLFEFFGQGLTASPSPEWFEAAAYILVLVLIILLTLAVFGQDVAVSLTSAIDDNGRGEKPHPK